MEEHYVYAYLNPKKEGNHQYGNYEFTHEPFYIGKGKGSRMTHHLKCKGRNGQKNMTIKRLLREGITPIIVKIVEGVSDEVAMKMEVDLITTIGRFDLGDGPLSNLTNGGDGHTGLVQSQETKDKRIVSLKKSTFYETVRSDEFRNGVSERSKLYYSNPENIRKHIERVRRGVDHPMYGKTISEKQKESIRKAHRDGKIKLTPEGRQRLVENGKSRKGIKHEKPYTSTINHQLTSPEGESFILGGSVELKEFCKLHKLQYSILENIVGLVCSHDVMGNRIHARNTQGWFVGDLSGKTYETIVKECDCLGDGVLLVDGTMGHINYPKGESHQNHNKIWVNDGVKQKLIGNKIDIPYGWILGTLQKGKITKSLRTNTFWVHNVDSQINKRVDNGELIDYINDGWIKGRINMKQYKK